MKPAVDELIAPLVDSWSGSRLKREAKMLYWSDIVMVAYIKILQ